MQPIPSTAEIMMLKYLGRTINQVWVDWACDMLVAGFDGEYLKQLAAEFAPFSEQSRLHDLGIRVFEELNLDVTNKHFIVRSYGNYVIDQVISGNKGIEKGLKELYQLNEGMGYDRLTHDFYLLYWAKDDLKYGDVQYYLDPHVTRENIDQVILEYFIEWKSKNENSEEI